MNDPAIPRNRLQTVAPPEAVSAVSNAAPTPVSVTTDRGPKRSAQRPPGIIVRV